MSVRLHRFLFVAIGLVTSSLLGGATGGQHTTDADILTSEAVHRAPLTFHLPYPKGKSYPVIQGVEGKFSHSGANRYAWDFAMPQGDLICAAASGRVVCLQQTFTTKALDATARNRANRIILDHGHGIFTQYLHLAPHSALVKEGDCVAAGQPIARSGDTGYSTRPHLHFQVQDALGQSLLARFAEVPGDGIPKEGHEYVSQNCPLSPTIPCDDSPFPLAAFLGQGVEITRTTMPGVRLNGDSVYLVAGRLAKPHRRGVLFVLPPEGGVPLWAQFFPVKENGEFELIFSLSGVRAAASRWSSELHESNPFALAIAPAHDDGTYWSDVSVPITLR